MLTKSDLIEALQPINSKLDNLGKGQQRLEARLDVVETRLSGLETRFEGLETRFDSLETRFDSLETRFDSLETRFDSLETRFDSLETRFDSLEKRMDTLEASQKRFEIMLEQSIKDNAAFFNQTWTYIDEIKSLFEKRIKKIEDHISQSHN